MYLWGVRKAAWVGEQKTFSIFGGVRAGEEASGRTLAF